MINDNGYKLLIDRIMNKPVHPPEELTVAGLTEWLDGYAQCQSEILDIIEELRKGPRD